MLVRDGAFLSQRDCRTVWFTHQIPGMVADTDGTSSSAYNKAIVGSMGQGHALFLGSFHKRHKTKSTEDCL